MKYFPSNRYHIKLKILSIILLLHLNQIYGYKLLNCYSSLPSSFYEDNTNEYQSSSLCYTTCSGKGYSYFALFDHNACFCGNSSPAGLQVSSSCDTYCYGYGKEMCGGTSAYSVYSVDDTESVGGSESSSESASSTSSKSKTSSSSESKNTKATESSHSAESSKSQTVITDAQSTSSEQQTATTVTTGGSSISSSSSEEAVVATSMVYSTELQTQGGSTIFVTNTITRSTQVLPTGNSTSTNGKSNSRNSKKKVNVGAIVGGIVGGVCGAIILLSIMLLGLRYYNKKHEEDRMEREYQEAIKPVEYVSSDILSSSSHSYSFDGGNMNGKLNDSLGKIGSDNLNNNNNNGLLPNPFDDSRRISTGSIITSVPDQKKHTKLTVVNPDE